MVERLTVIFFVILCLLLGSYLILAPWDALFGRWGDNFVLTYLADVTGLPVVRQVVASTWCRGAVTGLGVLNLIVGFWEAANFRKNVVMLELINREESGEK